MAGILDSMTQLLTPEVTDQIAKAAGVDAQQIRQGMGVAAPLVTTKLAQKTSQPGGAGNFMEMLNTAGTLPAAGSAAGGGDMAGQLLSGLMNSGTTTDMGSMLGGLLGGGSGDMGSMLGGLMGLAGNGATGGNDLVSGVMGQGINAVGGTLSEKLGFDVRPMLKLAVPLVMGLIARRAKERNLDAAATADMLQAEARAYEADPSTAATAALIHKALDAGEEAAAMRGRFSDADWEKVRLAPMAAAHVVMRVSPSGARGRAKEMDAAVETIDRALKSAGATSFLNVAFGDGQTAALGESITDAVTNANLINTIKAASEAVGGMGGNGAVAYRSMIISVAENVAEASKEGGFLGIGGKRVSEEEQNALNAVRHALG